MSKQVLLIGGVDSFGVPYTRDNKKHINHLKVVDNYLQTQNIDSKLIDMYSMHTYNDTDYVKYILEKDISLDTIKLNQIESINLCRKSGIFQFIQLPNKTKELYIIGDDDKNCILSEMIKEYEDVIFIYSCGVNDFLKLMGTDLAKLLSPKNMEEAFSDIEKCFSIIIERIEDNFKMLMSLNSNIEIYALSIYIPTRVGYIRKTVSNPIELYNKKLRELCSKYDNVYYIDNSNLLIENMAHVDWHPNYSGQMLLGENIISIIKDESKILRK